MPNIATVFHMCR